MDLSNFHVADLSDGSIARLLRSLINYIINRFAKTIAIRLVYTELWTLLLGDKVDDFFSSQFNKRPSDMMQFLP